MEKRNVVDMDVIRECILLVFLAILAKADIEKQELPISVLLLFGVPALLFRIIEGGILSSLSDCVPGVFLLLLSFLTKEQLGYGDGAATLIAGLLTGTQICMTLCLTAFCLAGCYSACSILRKSFREMTSAEEKGKETAKRKEQTEAADAGANAGTRTIADAEAKAGMRATVPLIPFMLAAYEIVLLFI